MKTKPNYHNPDARADTPVPCWAATIESAVEPALLARVLQELSVQNATIETLRYDAMNGSAHIEILFQEDEEHAHLLAKRWETIVTVSRVQLCRAMVARQESLINRAAQIAPVCVFA